MELDADHATKFGRFAAALELTPEQKENAWLAMSRATVSNSDETSLFFCVLAKMDGLSGAMKSDFVNGGKHLIAKLRATMGEELQKQLASVPDNLSKQIEGTLEVALRDLVSNVDIAVKKEAKRRQQLQVGGFALGAAMLTILAAGGGYAVGKAVINANAAHWSALASLEQGKTWLSLARVNDIDKALAQSCGPSDGTVISGAKVCDLRLFTSQPVATSKGADYVKLSAAEYAVKLGWLGYVLAALAGGLVVGVWGRLIRRAR